MGKPFFKELYDFLCKSYFIAGLELIMILHSKSHRKMFYFRQGLGISSSL